MEAQLRPLSEVSERAHMEWLSKTETAKLKNGEMTVLSYGYLSQAVTEAIIEERDTAYTLLREAIGRKRIFATTTPSSTDFGNMQNILLEQHVTSYNQALDDILTLLDHIYGKTDALTK